ncbi:hypothetical protein [Streptomyces prunicolor]
MTFDLFSPSIRCKRSGCPVTEGIAEFREFSTGRRVIAKGRHFGGALFHPDRRVAAGRRLTGTLHDGSRADPPFGGFFDLMEEAGTR